MKLICPQCNSSVVKSKSPKLGDCTLCMKCATPLIWKNRKLHIMTAEEISTLPDKVKYGMAKDKVRVLREYDLFDQSRWKDVVTLLND